MNDDFMTLLDKYRQEQQPHGFALERIELPDGDKPLVDTEAFYMEQQQPQQVEQSQPQFMQGLLGKTDDLANGLIAQSQAQTQQAMQASNMLQNQRNSQMAQTEQQAAQALQKMQQQQGGGLLGGLLKSYLLGGIGGLIGGGGTAAAAGSGVSGGFGGAVYPGGWLV